jgi:hypothetical protein
MSPNSDRIGTEQGPGEDLMQPEWTASWRPNRNHLQSRKQATRDTVWESILEVSTWGD